MKKSIFILIVAALSSCNSIHYITPNLHLGGGQVQRIENFQSQFVQERNVDIWLPANYSKREKYAVLYMHDGQMLFDSTKTWNKQEWRVDEIMDSLMHLNEIKKTIVVSIWNTEMRRSEYFPQNPFEKLPESFKQLILPHMNTGKNPKFQDPVQSDAYLKFIVKELKPFIDRRYSTKRDRENTFIMGSSMGGLISMYAICEYPEVFSGAGCLSTHWIGTYDTINNPIPQHFLNYLIEKRNQLVNHKLYFDFGTETLDRFYEPYQLRVDSLFRSTNFPAKNFLSLKFEGENHSETAWANRLALPLKFLLERQE